MYFVLLLQTNTCNLYYYYKLLYVICLTVVIWYLYFVLFFYISFKTYGVKTRNNALGILGI